MASEIDEEKVGQLIERLEAVPLQLETLFASIPEDKVREAVDEEWSAAGVLAHLRASHSIIQPRILQIIESDNPPLRPIDDRLRQQIAGYDDMDVTDSLQALRIGRAEIVTALRRIAPADWQRIGTHESRGVLSIWDIAENLVTHDEEHIGQLEAIVAKHAG